MTLQSNYHRRFFNIVRRMIFSKIVLQFHKTVWKSSYIKYPFIHKVMDKSIETMYLTHNEIVPTASMPTASVGKHFKKQFSKASPLRLQMPKKASRALKAQQVDSGHSVNYFGLSNIKQKYEENRMTSPWQLISPIR